VFNIFFVGYSLAENNLNSTYQYNMTPKKNSKTINYLKFKVSREVSFFVPVSVLLNKRIKLKVVHSYLYIYLQEK
jgi:hypothetical protein